MSINEKYLLLWDAINDVMKKNLDTAQEYSIMAENLRVDDQVSSVGLRGQAIGLLYANNNIVKELNNRGLLNLD